MELQVLYNFYKLKSNPIDIILPNFNVFLKSMYLLIILLNYFKKNTFSFPSHNVDPSKISKVWEG